MNTDQTPLAAFVGTVMIAAYGIIGIPLFIIVSLNAYDPTMAEADWGAQVRWLLLTVLLIISAASAGIAATIWLLLHRRQKHHQRSRDIVDAASH